jgi:molybdate transport system substrate-binding protein
MSAARAVVIWVLCAACLRSAWGAQADVPALAAASDLKFAVEEIAAQFRTASGRDVKLVFGSSGNFFRQIEQGAPFQIFMSADEAFILKLAEAGRTEGRGDLYATGRIVLFAPHSSRLTVDPALTGLKSAVAAGHITRFAIANPEHAPYGRAAEAALKKLGLWDALQPRLVLGENVSQAAQFASGGSAQGGIFAYSLALSPQVAKLGRYVVIPESLHPPLRQRMVLVKGAGETARAFYRFLQAPPARDTFSRYGFVLPADSR